MVAVRRTRGQKLRAWVGRKWGRFINMAGGEGTGSNISQVVKTEMVHTRRNPEASANSAELSAPSGLRKAQANVVIGTKQTFRPKPRMFAFGGKADIGQRPKADIGNFVGLRSNSIPV